MNQRITLHKLTHVVIKTGYAPPLSSLLSIERALRNNLEAEVSVVSASGEFLLVPCPFGFRLPARTMPEPKPAAAIKYLPESVTNDDWTECDAYTKTVEHELACLAKEVVEKFRGVRFSVAEERLLPEKAVRRVREMYNARVTGIPRIDLYEDLFSELRDWGAEALNPDSPMDRATFLKLDSETAALSDNAELPDYDIFCGPRAADPREGETLLSYSARLRDAKAVTEALGGTSELGGCICLKVDEVAAERCFEIIDSLRENNLSFCWIGGIIAMRYTETSDLKILTLEYDSEHG